jgi:undecaprenyl-diphosphatase
MTSVETPVTPGQALALGILQGLGEFLPISSSGHLIVLPWLVGWADHGLAFDVALHLGTLGAVLYAYGRDWVRIVTAGLRLPVPGGGEADGRLLWLLALASVPGGIAGLAFGDAAETTFRSPALVATTMAVVGTILLAADRRAGAGGEGRRVTVQDALLIGTAQALAIIPGVSRSGATISMALFLGYRREEAARFSFLLATPITAAAAAYKVPALVANAGGQLGVIVIGMVAAGVVGFACIRGLLSYVRTRDYRPFVYYRWAFAAVVFLLLLVRR